MPVPTIGQHLAVEPLLNAVPDHWEILRFKAAFERLDERNVDLTYPMASLKTTGEVVLRSTLGGRQEPDEKNLPKYVVAHFDDLVVNPMWLVGGAIGVSEIDGAVSPDYRVFRSNGRLLPKYAHHLLRSRPYRAQYSLYTRAQTTFDRRVQQNDLDNMPLLVPPLNEQQAIADYLDRETKQIDTLIAEQKRLVEMLKERIPSFNDHCFYGTEGKRTVLLKRVLRRVDRPPVPELEVVTAYRDGTVTLRSNRREEGYTFSEKENGYQEVRPGDLVFHGLDGFAGAVGISDSHGNATPVYHVCEAIAGDDPEYVALLLRHLGTSGFLATQAPSVRQRAVDFRNWSTLGRIPLNLPDLSTQRSMVRDIREEITRVDMLIAESERLIELSQERRAALITAAVTGQIDAWQEG